MTVRVDAASCSWLAYCDADGCGWRSPLRFTRADAYADADAHRSRVHGTDSPTMRARRQRGGGNGAR
jgi:hypothetical protein